MPHFIIDCSEKILESCSVEKLLSTVHDTADSTGLFKKGDIKVRVQPYKYFTVANTQSDFIHVFGHIMQGRTTEQKADLSKRIVAKLKIMFPDVPVISMNVSGFEKATYYNRSVV
ncbi:MAG TPA: 5-carboxymethyl-2-hydroxymuconate Delta-isomerase [Bacteroidia bacterium]|nr:5-carboxymethyl-2-hydroxymuconate Delta-isomerase [Bacteroidia bacterium]